MSLLAYCTLEADAKVVLPSQGVQSEAIVSQVEGSLRCLTSQFTAAKSGGEESIRNSALIFNRVLQTMLSQAAIIPFRFPSVVEDAQAISSYLRERQAVLLADLASLRDMVQMEIQVRLENEAAAAPFPQSGMNYLRQKQGQFEKIENVLSDLRQVLAPYSRDWRVRQSVNRARVYALVNRDAIDGFHGSGKTIELPEQVSVRITGPWPVSEFVKSNE
jgi:hypothetical protein